MSQLTPENLLAKINEYIKNSDEESALTLTYEYINNSKKKIWSNSMEELILKFIELAINQNKINHLKLGLNFFRSISQVSNLESFMNVITNTKTLIEEKFLKIYKKNTTATNNNNMKNSQIDNIIDDLDNDETNNTLFLSEDDNIPIEKENIILIQKFIWETYKILLDITKTNSKLLNLYSDILKSAFNFCKEKKRKIEFKRLCDSVRNYLQTLIKSEKKSNFVNKVMINDPEVLNTLIQIRLNLLDTAIELEQWLESFKTSEDIIFLVDKYEKIQIRDNNEIDIGKKRDKAKYYKLNPVSKIEFYNNISKLFWISNYPLYHSYSNLNIKDLISTKIKNLNKKQKERFDKLNIKNINEKILLSALSTSLIDNYTNYYKYGEELFESANDVEIETCQRMTNILHLNQVPNRKNLINNINNYDLFKETDSNIVNLYNLFENEENPIRFINKSINLLKYVEDNKEYNIYLKNIKENIIKKCVILLSKVYNTIKFDKIKKYFEKFNYNNIEIENILIEISRIGLVKLKIDYKKQMIIFLTDINKNEYINSNINNFILNSKQIIEDINETIQKDNLNIIKKNLYEQFKVYKQDSLKTTQNIIQKIKEKKEALKKYQIEKNIYKANLKIQTQDKKELEKKKELEREFEKKKLLLDEESKKELDIRLKKHIIELLRRYTNIIQLKSGKKIKLDDLLKDLNKISQDEIIKALEYQEVEFKVKNEKKLKETTKKLDYILREFRKRDNKEYQQKLEQFEKEFNTNLKEQSLEFYNQNIKKKEILKNYKDFKDKYFEEIKQKNVNEYEKEMNLFKQALDKRVKEDLMKELEAKFKVYYEDLEKSESKKIIGPITYFPKNEDEKNKTEEKKTNTDNWRKKEDNQTTKVELPDENDWRKKKDEPPQEKKPEQNDGFWKGSALKETNKKPEVNKTTEVNKKTEVKKPEVKKDDFWRKDPPKQKEKEEKKEDKKVKEDKKEESWRGMGNKEKKEDNNREWGRGTNIKDNKVQKKNDNDDWGRGAKFEPTDKKKTENKHKNKNDTTTDNTSWRKTDDNKKKTDDNKKKTNKKK